VVECRGATIISPWISLFFIIFYYIMTYMLIIVDVLL
jgi:hypothetical protein